MKLDAKDKLNSEKDDNILDLISDDDKDKIDEITEEIGDWL